MITPGEIIDAALASVKKSNTGSGYIAGFQDGANWALEQQRWIPIEEAWPHPLQRVIFVVDAPGIHEHGKVYGGTYAGEPDSPYLRARNSFSTPGMGYPASHWMPAPEPPALPEPPKQP